MIKLINEADYANMFLNEERHYPKFLDELKSKVNKAAIDAIYTNAKNWIFKFNKIIDIDCEYCDKIILSVTLKPNGKLSDKKEYRAYYFNKYDRLYNGKLYNPSITITCPYVNGAIYSSYLECCISHELTHLYDDWQSLKNGGHSINWQDKNVDSVDLINHLSSGNSDFEKGLSYIVYLSLKAEQKAFLSQTVQELKNLGCDQFNYKKLLKKTMLYESLHKAYGLFYEGLNNVTDEKLFEFNNLIFNDFKKSAIPKYNNKEFNPKSYRDKLIKWVNNIYHRIMVKYGSVVSYYVDKVTEDWNRHCSMRILE